MRVGDFIVASLVERLDNLEGTIASQNSQIQELERQVLTARDDHGTARQHAEELLCSLEERDAKIARLFEQRQTPSVADSAPKVAKLRR